MGQDVKGFSTVEVIRLNAGSPASNFAFTKFDNSRGKVCDAIILTNLGSNSVFVSFSGTALVTGGSSFMLLPPNAIRSLDLMSSGLSIAVSGGNIESECELIGLGI